jgi:hypothetical protein
MIVYTYALYINSFSIYNVIDVINAPINVKPQGGRSGICGAFDRFLFPHPLEFDWHHLPRVGIFELSTILHPAEEHVLRIGRNDFQAFHHKYAVCPTVGHLITFDWYLLPHGRKFDQKIVWKIKCHTYSVCTTLPPK